MFVCVMIVAKSIRMPTAIIGPALAKRDVAISLVIGPSINDVESVAGLIDLEAI
jgi:hypothetical protein